MSNEIAINLENPVPVIMGENTIVKSRSYKYGKCLQKCCDMDGSFFDAISGSPKRCKCTGISVIEGSSFVSFIITLGLFTVGGCAGLCCPHSSCYFGSLILPIAFGLWFIASWFFGITVLLLGLCIFFYVFNKHGNVCLTKCGCVNCASGFSSTLSD